MGTFHEYARISVKHPPDIDYGDVWQGTPEIDRRLRVILGDDPEKVDAGRVSARPVQSYPPAPRARTLSNP